MDDSFFGWACSGGPGTGFSHGHLQAAVFPVRRAGPSSLISSCFSFALLSVSSPLVGEVTRILDAVQQGEAKAIDRLLSLVYDELRRLAAQKMANEASGHTLQPTALVHEAWLRLMANETPHFKSRAHFFAAAAEAMRRILVEHARRKGSLKRGGGSEREELYESKLALTAPPDELLAIHEALDGLACKDPAAAELVKLRYFVGFSLEETAAALGLSPRSAGRLWAFARAWLRQAIESERVGPVG
jgi:RNA polymerase sigma factor (TIGR02999 family)